MALSTSSLVSIDYMLLNVDNYDFRDFEDTRYQPKIDDDSTPSLEYHRLRSRDHVGFMLDEI